MNAAQILCVGKDPGLLRSRCAVLEHAGYRAQAVMFHDADTLLASSQFDLIILSVILSADEKQHIEALVGDRVPVLTLKKLTFASELLAEVDRQLMYARQNSPA
jgi:DNA-binding response OmpR family regulator